MRRAARRGKHVMVNSPYRRVLAVPALRVVLPAMSVSSAGDGMTLVAVPWLALRLVPPAQAGAFTAIAVAAYTLPGVLLGLPLGRFLGGWDGRRLLAANSAVRGVCLIGVPVAAGLGSLSPAAYVALLACSSLLMPWSGAAKLTMIAELVPPAYLRTGNALVGAQDWLANLAGPALGGALIAAYGAPIVLGLDAVSWLLLGAATAWTRRRWPPAPVSSDPKGPHGTLRLLARNRGILALITLTFVFFLLYGPVEVALPVYVARAYHSAWLLGLFWALLSGGALIGAVLTGALRRLPLWPAALTIIAGWGATLLPLGFGAPLPVAIAGFTLGGLVYAPYSPLARELLQRGTPPDLLARTSAAWSSVASLAPALGMLLAGPVVAAAGAQATLLYSALATIALALVAVMVAATRLRGRPRPAPDTPWPPAAEPAPGPRPDANG